MSAVVQTGRHVSHYEVGELLGSGGMSEVYRATDLRLGRRVALKFLKPMADVALRQRIRREAQAASSLDHPNICTIFEVDEAGEDVFIAMAYYEGETLDRVLARGPLAPERALNIAAQAARGLAAAHEELIIHRDVKPANLMLARGDTVKILDFGIARFLGDPRVTDHGSVVGSPAYMSPEQLRDEPVDQRTDIWSLGAVLYEMLTGTRAFPGDGVAAAVASVLSTQPARASGVRPGLPGRVDEILAKALAKDRRLRYERMDDMARDLLELRSALDSGAITLRRPAAATVSSVAVLPFADMSPDRDQQFLCDGVAEEILRELARIPELYVASRTSAFQYRNQSADVREIGARLNVGAVLEGSVRRSGDRVRISAQLVSVDSDFRLWYERYERDMKDIFAIEDEIAGKIAQALKVTLVERVEGPGERTSAATEAYELFLQGRQFFHQHRRKACEIALQTFTRALELDPGFARAYAGVAECHAFLKLYFGRGEEAVAAADAASAKALELGPALSDAHAARGLALFLKKDFAQAEGFLRKAIALDPRLYDPHYIFGRMCFSQGRMPEAAEHFREACVLVPEAYDAWYLLGMCYRRTGEAAKARSADLECIEAAKKRLRSHPDDTRAWTMGASVLAELGEPERAAEWVARALAVDRDEPIIAYNAACVYAALGRLDEAFACLEAPVGQGSLQVEWVANDPDLDPLRADPRFETLLATARSNSAKSRGA
jgi:TolB-like protein/Flp pilus assembly protein TadD/tRNA A-37 threonylcarbamoyl transferase component Bud32